MESALVVDGLRKRYGSVVAVDGVHLAVPEGEIFGLVGPNGSGKTTTVECAYGLRVADAGRIRVYGVDPRAEPDKVARLVGVQLQDSALPDRIRVWEAVHLFAAMAPDPVDESRVLGEWGLAHKRRASFGSLSGGQRQRLLVALALVTRPRLVFLDEMTTGLDPTARREVWQLLEQVRRDGTTVVLVTHFMDEAERLCDRIAVLQDGRVLAEDTPAGLVNRYGGGARVAFEAPASLPPTLFDRLGGIRQIRRRDGWVEIAGDATILTGLGHALTVHGLGDTPLRVTQGSLEDAYLNLIGGARGGVD